MINFAALWADISTMPLFHLTLTIAAYQLGMLLYARAKFHPLAHPVLFAIVVLVAFLKVAHIDYTTYFNGAQFIHFLLGPATVALAIPLYRAYDHIRGSLAAIGVALIVGCLSVIIVAVGVGWVFGASTTTLLSLAPKSATTPIAMGVADAIGGNPSLTAVFVILTGILGAMTSSWVLNVVRVTDLRARGFATGLVAHGIGTAHKLRINELTGAFAGLAMGLNGLATAIIVPLLVHLFRR